MRHAMRVVAAGAAGACARGCHTTTSSLHAALHVAAHRLHAARAAHAPAAQAQTCCAAARNACLLQGSTFGIPGVEEHAHFLRDVRHAEAIRNKLISNIALAGVPGACGASAATALCCVVCGAVPGARSACTWHSALCRVARCAPGAMRSRQLACCIAQASSCVPQCLAACAQAGLSMTTTGCCMLSSWAAGRRASRWPGS